MQACKLCGSLIKLACLLAVHACMCVRSMWYMLMHIAAGTSPRDTYVVACVVFLCMKIFVCFMKQACLLAIISKFGGGVDNSTLWLNFAQQKFGA
jgi:hypothetical protein